LGHGVYTKSFRKQILPVRSAAMALTTDLKINKKHTQNSKKRK